MIFKNIFNGNKNQSDNKYSHNKKINKKSIKQKGKINSYTEIDYREKYFLLLDEKIQVERKLNELNKRLDELTNKSNVNVYSFPRIRSLDIERKLINKNIEYVRKEYTDSGQVFFYINKNDSKNFLN